MKSKIKALLNKMKGWKKTTKFLVAIFVFGVVSFGGLTVLAFSDWHFNHRTPQPTEKHAESLTNETNALQETPTGQETITNPVNPTQATNRQEAIVKCKAKLYKVTATQEQCNAVDILDKRAQARLDELDKDFDNYLKETKKKTDKCDDTSPSVYQIADLTKCYGQAEDDADDFSKKQETERKKINKDLGNDIDKIIK